MKQKKQKISFPWDFVCCKKYGYGRLIFPLYRWKGKCRWLLWSHDYFRPAITSEFYNEQKRHAEPPTHSAVLEFRQANNRLEVLNQLLAELKPAEIKALKTQLEFKSSDDQ